MMMYFGDFKVYIQEVPGMVVDRIYLVQKNGSTTSFITRDGTTQTVERGAGPSVTEGLYFAEMSPDQLQALAEALAAKGIKTNKDSVAEGRLLATERHLEDMRLIALHEFRGKTTTEGQPISKFISENDHDRRNI